MELIARFLYRIIVGFFTAVLVMILYNIMLVRQLPKALAARRLRIASDTTCAPASGGVYAIVVKYVGFGIEEGYLGLLDAMKKAGVNVILVLNGVPDEEMLAVFEKRVHRILVRDNVGRDMGAYRAATLHLRAAGLKPQRVVYCNDSNFYLEGGELDRLIRELATSSAGMHGCFENHAISHHLGSYLFSISGEFFSSSCWLEFWQKYLPFNIRRYAISKGELRLTNIAKRNGFSLDVAYPVEKLAGQLIRMDLNRLLELIPLMSPLFSRRPLLEVIDKPLSPLKIMRGNKGKDPDFDAVLSEETLGRLSCNLLVDAYLNFLTRGSQVHLGFGLFHRLLDSPIVKKDLIQRGTYNEKGCLLVLADVDPKVRSRIIRELSNRGDYFGLTFWARLRQNYGLE